MVSLYLFDEAREQRMKLPKQLIDYLRSDAPKYVERDAFPECVEMWAETDLETFNREYEVGRYAPGFYGIGSDGGGEMLALDSIGKIYCLPFIGMSPEAATLIADSWVSFYATFTETES